MSRWRFSLDRRGESGYGVGEVKMEIIVTDGSGVVGSAVKSGYGVCSGTVDYSLASHGLTANLEVEVPESEREALRALLDGCVTAPDPL